MSRRRSGQRHAVPHAAGGPGRSRLPTRRGVLALAAVAGVVLLAWLAWPAVRRTCRGFLGERRRLVETVERLVADAGPEARPLLAACGDTVLDIEDRYPESVDTVIALARFYGRFGAPADAARSWTRCRELDPRSEARAREAVADIALEEGRFADAAAEYAAALAADPAREPAAIHLAEALLGDGRPAEAADSLRRSIARHGRSVAACSLLGQALLQLDDPATAREELETAVRLGPDYPAARHALAAACGRTGDAAAAAVHREAFAELQKRKESRHRTELRTKDDIANLRRTLASTLTDAARVHFAHDDGPHGEAALARAIAASPDEPDSRLLLAQLRESQRRHDEAAAAYLDAARVAPDDSLRQLVAAEALERLGRDADAERLLERLVELLPARPAGYAALAGLLHRTGRDAGRARDLARKAVDCEPAEGYWWLLERAARAAGDEAGAAAAAAGAAESAAGK